MIGVVVPVHDEERLLARCLQALATAARHPELAGEAVHIVVALDACSDGSRAVAARHGVACVEIGARNVGLARAAGATAALAAGARWLAFTDADTRVAPDWLVAQLSLRADAVCGTVAVDDWSDHGDRAGLARRAFERRYQDRDEHRHIHGANLGVGALAYQSVGGFRALACSEDVALVEALIAQGARIAWSALPRVVTSARLTVRARGGFGDTLAAMAGWPAR